jgi:vacuole morphology and inheritance protein 14
MRPILSLTFFGGPACVAIVDARAQLSADKDLNVKNGAQLLDRLVKDIVTESDAFDIER